VRYPDPLLHAHRPISPASRSTAGRQTSSVCWKKSSCWRTYPFLGSPTSSGCLMLEDKVLFLCAQLRITEGSWHLQNSQRSAVESLKKLWILLQYVSHFSVLFPSYHFHMCWFFKKYSLRKHLQTRLKNPACYIFYLESSPSEPSCLSFFLILLPCELIH
jgi:hypothetical protein